MDTSAYNHENPGIAAYDLTTGDTVRQKTLRSEHWWLKTDSREAPVAEFFGLAELRRRARKVVAAREKQDDAWRWQACLAGSKAQFPSGLSNENTHLWKNNSLFRNSNSGFCNFPV